MDTQILPPLKVPTPPKPTSVKSLVVIFAVAFIVILLILNGPVIIKAVVYPFTHSTESDNEQLTQQYRDIYGYEKRPELITAVRAATVAATPSPSWVPATIVPSQLSA